MKRVTAAILIEDGRLFLAQRAESDPPWHWELPGGKVEAGESASECLVRELDEELGMRAHVVREYAESEYVYEHGAFRLLGLIVERLNDVVEPRVHQRVAWVPLREVRLEELAPADRPIVKQLKGETA